MAGLGAFECFVCASVYNTGQRIPLLLECGHTFCQSCVQHNLGAQRCCPYCRHPIQKHVDDLPRNYALENAMEAANLPLVELMDRWGLSNAERMMVKPDQLTLDSLMSRKGYTGEVWRGTLWGKPVAVKLLPLLDVDERQLECLRREVAVLLHTTGECKQVCIYKGFCVKEGSFAIIMKLYSGSLAARVAAAPGRRLPLPVALKLSADIVKGLVELHRLGVTAADLKPDNVLIDDELGDAVIADFGISSVVTTTLGNNGSSMAAGGRGSAVRSSGGVRGTPNYMSPEQFAPGCRVTNKVDIWGFAATLLHMITGAPPWQHDTLMQICTAVGVAKQAPPLPEGLPGPLRALLCTCFDADPARRPTAVYLLKALQAMGPVLQQQMAVAAAAAAAAAAATTSSSSSKAATHPSAAAAAGHAGKAGGPADDDKQGGGGVDQYLAQLGLPSSRLESVSSGGGGMPSAPPLPHGLGRRSSSSGGAGAAGGAGGSSSRHKLPRVLWSEEEAVREVQQAHAQQQQQQQQQLRQGANTAAGCLGSLSQHTQQQKPHWAPHHARSASEQVSGLGSRAYQQQQQLQQQMVQPQEAAHWQQQQQQSHHARSRSEVGPGWGAVTAAEAAAGTAGFLSSRGHRAADNASLPLPTHHETAANNLHQQQQRCVSPGKAGEDSAAAGAHGKRQRQQWNVPAAAAPLQSQQQQQQPADAQGVPPCAAAADDGKCSTQDPQQQWYMLQQQALAVHEPDPPSSAWETPFNAHSCSSASPAPAGEQQQHAGQAGSKRGMPPPVLVYAHDYEGGGPAEDIQVVAAAAADSGLTATGSSHGSSASLSRAASQEARSSSGCRIAGADAVAAAAGRSSPSVCSSRSGSARRPPRTLSSLLLGRAGSRTAMPNDLAAAEPGAAGISCCAAAPATASCGGIAGAGGGSSSNQGANTAGYPPSLAKIRMAFGPASPERVPRAGAFGSSGNLAAGSDGSCSSSSILAAAAGAGSTAAAAASCTGGAAAAAAGSVGTAAVVAGGASHAATSAAAVGAAAGAGGTAVASAGVMAAVTLRFTRGGSKGKASQPAGAAAPISAAAGEIPGLPSSTAAAADSRGDKPSRWRSLFGSPSRHRPSPQHCSSLPADMGGRRCSVLDSAGVHSGGSYAGEGPASSIASCSSSPAGYMRSPAAGAPAEVVALADTSRPLSPCKKGALAGDAAGVSGELHQPPLTPGSAAAHAANVAAAEAARASGSCSPLKAHARNLSLPSKLMVLGSADSSPASSPNPVAPAACSSGPLPAQHETPAAASGGRCASPSKLGPQPKAAGAGSRGSSGDGAAVDAAPGSSGSSHSQLLAEALQLEVLARSLSQTGRHAEAKAALRNSLSMISKQLGPGHPNTVAATTRLALHLNRHAKHAEAEQLLRQVLAHRQAMLGRKHPQVAAASINLAACLYSQGHYNAAARLYSTALEVRRAALGDSHADTAACLNNLALCHSRLGEWSRAEQLFRDALSARVAALGQLHPDVAITAHQLGHCLGQLGQHTEALVYHKQGLWVRQQQERHAAGSNTAGAGDGGSSSNSDGSSGSSGSSRGSSSGGTGNPAEDLVASHRCVALCLSRLGCDSQAQEHLAHVLQVRSSQLAALHPPPPPGAAGGGTLAGARSSRAVSSGGGGKAHNGLDAVDWGVLADGDSRLSKPQSAGLLAMAVAAEELARCLSRQGQHAEAEAQFWAALEARSQVLGARHELVLATEEQLRACLELQC